MFFPTIGIRACPSKEALSLEGISPKMSNQGRSTSIKPPLFNGNNFIYWKMRTKSYLQSLRADVWAIVEGGYRYLATVPTNIAEKKTYETQCQSCQCFIGKSVTIRVCQSHATKPKKYGTKLLRATKETLR